MGFLYFLLFLIFPKISIYFIFLKLNIKQMIHLHLFSLKFLELKRLLNITKTGNISEIYIYIYKWDIYIHIYYHFSKKKKKLVFSILISYPWLKDNFMGGLLHNISSSTLSYPNFIKDMDRWQHKGFFLKHLQLYMFVFYSLARATAVFLIII